MSTDALLINAAETARLLGVSKPIVYQLARREDFPSIKIGNRVLIQKAGLEKWVDEHLTGNREVML